MKSLIFVICGLITSLLQAGELDYFGNFAVQLDGFLHPESTSEQSRIYPSVSFQPEFSYLTTDYQGREWQWDLTLFARIDGKDPGRNHTDVRIARALIQSGAFQWRIGFDQVFWGVTESVHIVDIINQTDTLENIDGEEKLGQPMISGSYASDYGTFDIYALIGFRDREFPSRESRLRGEFIPVIKSVYESNRESRRVDWALRYQHSIDIFDIGISLFHGTDRTPDLLPILSDNKPALVAFYPLRTHIALDIQATYDAWLLKLETLQQKRRGELAFTTAAGFEYTYYQVFETDADIGILAEYLYHDDKENPFQNDLFLGSRLTLNDEASTELLVGMILDLDTSSQSYFIESSRRIGESYKLTLEGRFFTIQDNDAANLFLDQADFIRVEWAWFY